MLQAPGPSKSTAVNAKENFLLFTPMLHEVAGSDVSVTDIVQPLRKMLRHTRILIAEVKAIDLGKKEVRALHEDLHDPSRLPTTSSCWRWAR